MQRILHFLLVFLLFLAVTQTACARNRQVHNAALSGTNDAVIDEMPLPRNITILHSAKVMRADQAHGQKAYLMVRDKSGVAGHFKGRISQELGRHGFRMTEQPSKADRIIEIEVLSRRKATGESIRHCVERGYGSRTQLVEGQLAVLLCDALLVRRKAPQEGRHAELRNISARNAVSNTQLRIAVIGQDASILNGRVPEDAFAADIATLAAANRDQTVHRNEEPAKRDAKQVRNARKQNVQSSRSNRRHSRHTHKADQKKKKKR